MDFSSDVPADSVRVPKQMVDDLAASLRVQLELFRSRNSNIEDRTQRYGRAYRRRLDEAADLVDAAIARLVDWKPGPAADAEQLVDVSVRKLEALRDRAAVATFARHTSNSRGRVTQFIGKAVITFGTFLGVSVLHGGTGLELQLLEAVPGIGTVAEMAASNAWLGFSMAVAIGVAGNDVRVRGKDRQRAAFKTWQGEDGVGTLAQSFVDDSIERQRYSKVSIESGQGKSVEQLLDEAMSWPIVSELPQSNRSLSELTRQMLHQRRIFDPQLRNNGNDAYVAERLVAEILSKDSANPLILAYEVRQSDTRAAQLEATSGNRQDFASPEFTKRQDFYKRLNRALQSLGLAEIVRAPTPCSDPAIEALRANIEAPTDLRLLRAVGLRIALVDMYADRAAGGSRYSGELEAIVQRDLITPISAAEREALRSIDGPDFKDPGSGFDFGMS